MDWAQRSKGGARVSDGDLREREKGEAFIGGSNGDILDKGNAN